MPAVDPVYRVARSDGVTRFSEISPQDAQLDRAGNRYDVVGGGVLYAATTAHTCFAETLARYRVPAAVRAVIEEMDDDGTRMVCGGVPADWRARRVLASLRMPGALPFIDAADPRTQEYFTSVIPQPLAKLGVDVLDQAAALSPDRRLTRLLSSWAYTAPTEDGSPAYSGIRYLSRITNTECWAIFDATPIEIVSLEVIDLANTDLRDVADVFGLRLF